jgi:predicted transcriptional regulator
VNGYGASTLREFANYPPRIAVTASLREFPHTLLTVAMTCGTFRTLVVAPAEESIMPRFTQGELEVMRILWAHGELKPAEIHSRFPRQIKNPSLRSYLAILLEKGHIVRRRVGKAYFYRAKTRRQSTFRAMLGDLIRICCDGSVENLVCQLIRNERLSEADLLELKRLSEESRRFTAPPGEVEQP